MLLSVLGDAMVVNPPGAGVARRLGVDIWVIAALWVLSEAWMRRPKPADGRR